MAETKCPQSRHRVGSISAAVFENKVEKNGQTVIQYSIPIQKGYKDPSSGEWVNHEIWLFPSEIPQLITVARKAYEQCVLKEDFEDA